MLNNPVKKLPDIYLDERSQLTFCLNEYNIETFHQAADWVWHLPYGRNSCGDPFSVLLEERGTCSTKHAFLAQLAQDHGLPVKLMVGIYLMNEANTTGVGVVLREAGLPAVPEAHCYLMYAGQRIDLTRCVRCMNSPFDSILMEQTIRPEQIGEHKKAFHQRMLRQWATQHHYDWEEVWRVREACIVHLGKCEPLEQKHV